MPFKLALISLVYAPSAGNDSSPDVALLQKANAWLQRRNANAKDDLLLIGVGFDDEPAFQSILKPYGLGSAEMAVIPHDQIDETDANDLGDSVGSIVEKWISENHKAAIPIADWSGLIGEGAYPTGNWWWVGLESADQQHSASAALLEDLLPDAYDPQATTWAAIIAEALELNPQGEDHEVYEAEMSTITLARWLTGFDAATENNFYDFSADAAGIDRLRLGFEAGRNHESELGDYFDGNDYAEGELDSACLKACMENRNGRIRDALSSAFGGNSALFWGLYASIWPEFNKPMHQAMDDLLNLRTAAEEGDLERPLQFVTDGWIEFSEE